MMNPGSTQYQSRLYARAVRKTCAPDNQEIYILLAKEAGQRHASSSSERKALRFQLPIPNTLKTNDCSMKSVVIDLQW